MRKKRILFFGQQLSPFIRQDEKILSEQFDLDTFSLEPYTTIPSALINYSKVIWWLMRKIIWCDALFIRFADVYGFFLSCFARLFQKKLFVIVGGFDAAWIPDLGYGTYHKKRSRFFTEFTLNTAHKIFPVSHSLVSGYEGMNKAEGHQVEGILNLYPSVDPDKIIVVPNGYRIQNFKSDPDIIKSNEVLTIAMVRSYQTYLLKGIDVFVALATKNPGMPFTLVGTDPEQIRQWTEIPPNLNIVSAVPHEGLLEFFQRAKVYMCLSMSEGMPNALSEAMLCECVPVGGSVSGIPNVIGDSGVSVDRADLSQVQAGLQRALAMDGKSARQRIVTQFPLEKRKRTLIEILRAELD